MHPSYGSTQVRASIGDRVVNLTARCVAHEDLVHALIEIEGLTRRPSSHVGVNEGIQDRTVLTLIQLQLSGEVTLFSLEHGPGVMSYQANQPTRST